MADQKQTVTAVDDKQVVTPDEKQHIVASELEGSGISSPAAEYEDLPDPDVGKSDAERAALVRPLPSLAATLQLTSPRTKPSCGKWISGWSRGSRSYTSCLSWIAPTLAMQRLPIWKSPSAW